MQGAAPDRDVAHVDFYVLAQASDVTRLRLACRVAERAFLSVQRVLAWTDDAQSLKSFDDLLWTFGERAFVPHELLRAGGEQPEAPVLLTSDTLPEDIAALKFDLLLNLRSDEIPRANDFGAIAEVLDADPARRTAGRARFRKYRDAGLQPATHNLDTDTDLPAAS